jgi:hypothetical protein
MAASSLLRLGTDIRRLCVKSAQPLIIIPFCPDKAMLAGFLGSFALYLLSALAGRHNDADVISLIRRAVNNPNPAMKAERSVSKTTVLCDSSSFPSCAFISTWSMVYYPQSYEDLSI